jgi:CheY-like chemotaxis protein
MFTVAQATAPAGSGDVRRTAPMALAGLAARLQDIAAAAGAAEDALEPALEATVAAVGAVAGALCLYDERRQLLRLAVEAGLSEEGCRRLRAVRGNDPSGWDIPLTGLLNRRVYIMENAAQHRYVPPLLDDPRVMRAVGCFPLTTRGALLGSLVLVASRPHVFDDRAVRALQDPLRELGKMILAVRQRTAGATAPPPASPEPAAAAPAREAAAGEVEALRARVDAAEAALDAARATSEALREERDRIAAEAEALRGEVARLAAASAEADALRRRLAEVEQALAREGARCAELERAVAGGASAREEALGRALEAARQAEEARGAAERERPAPSGGRVVPITASRRPQRASAARLVAVLDTAGAWERLGADEWPVTVVAPGPDAAARLAQLEPSRLLVNLAAPGAFDTLAGARAAGVEARCWGCIVVPGNERALRLGLVEPAGRPIDADAVVAALAAHATSGGRVFTAGADGDALISLRQVLSRKGLSVSIAWDAKQAAELLAVVRPHLAVVDLELPPRDGFGVVARLALLDPPPHLVLVAGGEDFVGGFAAALAEPALGSAAVSFEAVVRAVRARGDGPPRGSS